MKKFKLFKTVTVRDNPEVFEEKIQYMLNEGWKFAGKYVSTYNETYYDFSDMGNKNYYFSQPMMKIVEVADDECQCGTNVMTAAYRSDIERKIYVTCQKCDKKINKELAKWK